MSERAPASVLQPRIACLLPSLAVGGAELFMIKLVNGFVARGYRVDLVLAIRSSGFARQLDARVRIVDLQATGSLTAFWPLVSYLRKERPAVLLSSHVNTNVIAVIAARLARARTQVFVRESTTPSVNDSLLVGWKSRVVAHLRRWAYPLAARIIAPSNGVAEDLTKYLGVPRKKIAVIHNGVDCDGIGARAAEAVDHPYFLSGEPVILSVGRLCVEKDFGTLIAAFAGVLAELPARLIILGEGPARAELEALIGHLNIAERVSLPGFVGNPAKYVHQAAVFALSSICEGFPNALVEAMAVGTRVVSTDCRSGPREILMGGKWGGLVRIKDVDDMHGRIVDALRGGTPPMPMALLREKFGMDRALDGYLESFGLAAPAVSSAGK
jgi:glycosyltransferase involved in cell wall biosynthesis